MRILAKFVNVVFALVLLQQTGLSQPKPPSNQGKTSPDQKQRSRNAGTGSAAGVQPITFDNESNPNVSLKRNGQQYEAFIQPLLSRQLANAKQSLSCNYDQNSSFRLTKLNGQDLSGVLPVGLNSELIKVIATAGTPSGPIVFTCNKSVTTTLNIKVPSQPPAGDNIFMLGQSVPLHPKLILEGDRYVAHLTFAAQEQLADSGIFECTYNTSSEWQLMQDKSDAAGYLKHIVLPARIDLFVTVGDERSHDVKIELSCSNNKGEGVASPQILATISSAANGSTTRGGSSPSLPAWVWPTVIFLGSVLVLIIAGNLYWMFRKRTSNNGAKIRCDDEYLERKPILDLGLKSSKTITLQAPKGYRTPNLPPHDFVEVKSDDDQLDELDKQHNDAEEGVPKSASGKQRQGKGKGKGGGRSQDTNKAESANGKEDKRTYTLTLKPETKGSGADILCFASQSVNADRPDLFFPVVIRWNISSEAEVKENREAPYRQRSSIGVQTDKQPAPAPDLKAEIINSRNQVLERHDQIDLKLRGLTQNVSDLKELFEAQESLRELKKQILDSLYSVVNGATGDSLGEIRDALKRQMKEDSDRLFKDLEKLMAGREQIKEAEAGNGSSDARPHLGLERLVSERATSKEVEEAVRLLLADPSPNNDGAALDSLARNARELAVAIEEVESRFRSSNLNVPKLTAEMRLRLLRLEWLAQKYDDFRRKKSVPASVELSTDGDGLEKLSQSIAKGIENSLEYWHDPVEFLQAGLDQLVSRDLPEVIKMCDSAGKRGAFDDLVQKLLQVSHLVDISPRSGDRYDPAGHLVLDFESGNRDTIIRVTTRGFRYKQEVLNKPTVIVGR